MTDVRRGPPIARRYLHQEVVERLRTLINSGELPPRSRLNEMELAEQFGISRTPLREGLKVLAAEGLVSLLPNHGARVASLSTNEIEDMIDVLAGLEAMAAELACSRMTEEEIDAVSSIHEAMIEAWKRGDESEYLRLNRQIHEMIMRASRNATLQGIYAGVSGRVQVARYTAHKTKEQWRKAIDEHESILALLRKRDGEALATLMRQHIRGKVPVIAAAFGRESGPSMAGDRTSRDAGESLIDGC